MQIRSGSQRFASPVVLVLGILGLCAPRVAGESIAVSITQQGTNLYQYTYTMSGFNLMVNQELAIQFDLADFAALSNGVAPSGFTLALLQPNNPPGTAGDYTVVSLGTDDSMAGVFSVYALLQTTEPPPCCQPFFVYQLTNGVITGTLSSGVTSTPEPSSGFLVAAGGAVIGIFCILPVRLRLRRQTARVI